MEEETLEPGTFEPDVRARRTREEASEPESSQTNREKAFEPAELDTKNFAVKL